MSILKWYLIIAKFFRNVLFRLIQLASSRKVEQYFDKLVLFLVGIQQMHVYDVLFRFVP